jgi:hypothetical protein
MPRALWLLQWLGLISGLRRAVLGLRTPKGLVSAGCWVLLGALCLASCLLSWLVGPTAGGPFADFSLSIEQVERHGSLVLLALCVFTAVKTTGKGAIVAFGPPEVVFLVAGPFSRRQLLTYKFLQMLLAFAVVALAPTFGLLVFGSFAHLPPGPWPARYLGILFTLLFLKLVADSLTSLALLVGARAYTFWRKVALYGAAALAVCCVLYVGVRASELGWGEALRRFEEMPVASAVLQVPRAFLRATVSERYWPDFVVWGGACLAIDAALFWAVIRLDAVSIETAAAEGERLHARLERIRAGEPVSILTRTSATARTTLPGLPWWGGIGPLAWRQLQGLLRRRAPLVFFILIPLGEVLLANFMLQQMPAGAGRALQMLPLVALILFQSLFVPGLYTFDFRRDFDRMEALKTLPIGSAPLVLGQVLTPVLCTTIVQALGALALTLSVADGLEAALLLWSAVLLGVPLTLLATLLDNVAFLLSPSRPIPTPGAQFSGLKIALGFGRIMLLYLGAGIAGGVGAAVYYLAGRQFWLAGIAVWLVLAACATAVVPLAALLFRRFDVARERPQS